MRLLRRGYSFTDGIDPVTNQLDAGLVLHRVPARPAHRVHPGAAEPRRPTRSTSTSATTPPARSPARRGVGANGFVARDPLRRDVGHDEHAISRRPALRSAAGRDLHAPVGLHRRTSPPGPGRRSAVARSGAPAVRFRLASHAHDVAALRSDAASQRPDTHSPTSPPTMAMPGHLGTRHCRCPCSRKPMKTCWRGGTRSRRSTTGRTPSGACPVRPRVLHGVLVVACSRPDATPLTKLPGVRSVVTDDVGTLAA